MFTAEAALPVLAAPCAAERANDGRANDGRLPVGLALPVVLGMSGGLWVLIYQGFAALVG